MLLTRNTCMLKRLPFLGSNWGPGTSEQVSRDLGSKLRLWSQDCTVAIFSPPGRDIDVGSWWRTRDRSVWIPYLSDVIAFKSKPLFPDSFAVWHSVLRSGHRFPQSVLESISANWVVFEAIWIILSSSDWSVTIWTNSDQFSAKLFRIQDHRHRKACSWALFSFYRFYFREYWWQ